ncbi:MAG: hypothetical protein RLP98_13590 [Devosia sp.]
MQANAFKTLAERRAWLDTIKMPANDSDIQPVLAWPTMERMVSSGRIIDARKLAQWSDGNRPIAFPTAMQAANDNGPTYDGHEKAIWATPSDRADPMDVDRVVELRPTINETMSAANRVSVTTTRHAKGKWSKPIRRLMQFQWLGAEMKAYFKDGRRWAVRQDKARGERGRTVQRASDSFARRYLSIGGVLFPPQWKTHDGGRWWEPTGRAAVARTELEQLGVDGSIPPDRLPIPTKAGGIAIAKGAHWLCGMIKPKGKTGEQTRWTDIWDEIERTAAAVARRSAMLPDDAEVLDLATTRMSAREIGECFGRRGKSAERWAVRAIDRALEKLAA